MLFEDQPGFPCYILIYLQLNQSVDLATLETASQQVCQRHPLFCSTIGRVNQRLVWKQCPTGPLKPRTISSPGLSVDRTEPQPSLSWWQHIDSIDIYQEPGLQIIAITEPSVVVTEPNMVQPPPIPGCGTSDKFLLYVHHSCTDGKGLLDFVRQLIATLNGASCRADAQQVNAMLRQRGQFGRTWSNLASRVIQQWVGLKGALQFLTRRPVQISMDGNRAQCENASPDQLPEYAACAPKNDPQPSGPENSSTSSADLQLLAKSFPVHVPQLKSVCRNLRCTLNDLLLAMLFVSLNKFKSKFSPFRSEKDWLRFMVPINMRNQQQANAENMPAANVVSVVFIDRRQRDIANPIQLLQGIHEEMQLIKQRNLGATFIHSLEMTRWLPGGLERATGQQTGSISTVLTNLGPLAEDETTCPQSAGDKPSLCIEDFFLWPPLPAGCSMAFAVGSFRHQLRWGIVYDANRVAKLKAEYWWEQLLLAYEQYAS